MGKNKKDKKKGKGAEKTTAKTEKKLTNKIKKELQAKGEDDIETILSQLEKEEKKRLQVTEALIDPPSRRLNFSLVAHPDKEQLILYGGEYFNGQKTFVYGDLFFYNIPNNTWTVVKAPGGPPPRCGHQMVVSSANKGQLWVFGGEFASPTQSQFYHYKDLWVFHLETKTWEKIAAPNGPSARSGHRMVLVKKHLFVFGGFHDNLRDYKYFNDLYNFNIETYVWTKLEPTGTAPLPRSGCCMVALNDGKILIYGGYSKERLKKDVDKGLVFNDAFLLNPDKNDATGTKYKWSVVKLGGITFSPRCSMPIVSSTNNSVAYTYGGVFDVEDDEENLSGHFYNDFYQIDLEKLIWKNVSLSGKKEKNTKARRNKNKGEEIDEGVDSGGMEVEKIEEKIESTTISDDGVFKVTVGPAPSVPEAGLISKERNSTFFQPSPRINCGLAIKHGILYLYGGMFEEGDKQITYSDFYSLDLKKLDEWKTIIPDDTSKIEWLGSESESDDENSDEEEEDDEESEMEIE
ncbi:kelch domain-containing protein 4 [Diorhabda sublineata]|uniref:kelch domain-containing protein 4 n=1 Tax=Diorhabda sublineata TaxID=1163346 RepID=UPI0024E0E2BA|nr:kelch domain-containing protein 4 [Diorhabda sublineata]